MVRILCKERKKVEFLCCKWLLLTINKYSSCCLINLDSSDFDNIVIVLRIAYKSVISCKVCLNSCNKLARAEWLGHVIIRTNSKSSYLINIFLLGRYHDNRNILNFSYLLAYLETISSGKHDIKDTHINILMQCSRKATCSIITYLNLISVKFKVILLNICNTLFIFYN